MIRAVWYDAPEGTGRTSAGRAPPRRRRRLLAHRHRGPDGRVGGRRRRQARGSRRRPDVVPDLVECRCRDEFRRRSTVLERRVGDGRPGPRPPTPRPGRRHGGNRPQVAASGQLSPAVVVPAAVYGGSTTGPQRAGAGAGRWRADRGHGERRGREPRGPRQGARSTWHLDLSRTIGWFTAIYPVRLDPEPSSGTTSSRPARNWRRR